MLVLSFTLILVLSVVERVILSISTRYTRGNFIFPEAQPFPHNSFSEEVTLLDSYFGKLGSGSQSYVMGDPYDSQIWHIYSASAQPQNPQEAAYGLEMCMTGLDNKKASVFFKKNTSSAASMMEESGIRQILPKSNINDFEFDPCGYSMNGIEANAVSTIHVTPEDGFSYASFEAVGYDFKSITLNEMVERVLACFTPAEFSVALHTEVQGEKLVDKFYLDVKGYYCREKTFKTLGDGGAVMYNSFVRSGHFSSPTSILNSCWCEDENEEDVAEV